MGTNVESPMDDMAKQNQTIFSETTENEKIVDNEEILENDEEMDLYLARYLAAFGKKEEELNVIDRFCLKIVYFIKGGESPKVSGNYEDTEEYEQTQKVRKYIPKLVILGGSIYILLKTLYHVYIRTH